MHSWSLLDALGPSVTQGSPSGSISKLIEPKNFANILYEFLRMRVVISNILRIFEVRGG